jgi:hypothetical protein
MAEIEEQQDHNADVVDDSLTLLTSRLDASPAQQIMEEDVTVVDTVLSLADEPWSSILKDRDYKLIQTPSETNVIAEIPGIRPELKSVLNKPYNKAKKKEVADVQDLQRLMVKQLNALAVVATRVDRILSLVPEGEEHNLLQVVAEHAVRDTKKLMLRMAVLMSKSSEIVRDTARTASGLRKHDKTYETYATPDSDVEELRMLKEEKKSSALIS